ncbi:glycosyltransferase family 2 protein [Methyloceanibacter sp.]|uniref:glycosyltransferase family 2 protein n=1 Tax=Methyloceanibacter sp. TaxID=1965321 RepID=UPI002D73F94B|nr:glycosyltransferase family 2 protein [Methyloceanibacter sp.]HZP08711.1 glycosyltransferase family 2 protein [Methyloceanibacter sp.]
MDMRAESAAAAMATELTVVVPTFNERENVPLLVERLDRALAGIAWEVIFVDDDSPDGTADAVRDLARRDPRVRGIERIGRRGLSSATVEGVLASSSPYFAVMDADLQHDDERLPDMLARIKAEHLDIVVGSRHIEGGTLEGLNRQRQAISRLAGKAGRLVIKADLSDPMSGYFLMDRRVFDETVHNLSLQGFKILLDLFASAPRPLRFAEVACRFLPRQHGQSKLDSMAAWEFGMLILDKLIGRYVPVRFVVFAFVGGTGLAVHLVTLYLLSFAGVGFAAAQTVAVIAAMTWNFFLNNLITYRDRRLRGFALVRGLLTFYAICAVGAVANIGVAEIVYSDRGILWLAGIAGAAIGVVWNFAVSNYLTWRRRTG